MDTESNDTKQEEDHFHGKLEPTYCTLPTHSNQPAVAQTPQTGPAVAHFAEAARALQQLLKGSQGATRRRSKSERGARDRRSLGERRTESLRATCSEEEQGPTSGMIKGGSC